MPLNGLFMKKVIKTAQPNIQFQRVYYLFYNKFLCSTVTVNKTLIEI